MLLGRAICRAIPDAPFVATKFLCGRYCQFPQSLLDPLLFPTRLRGTGAGFTYNIGRLIAAFGPFLVGSIAARGANALDSAMNVLFWVGAVPIIGIFLLPLVIETRGKELMD